MDAYERDREEMAVGPLDCFCCDGSDEEIELCGCVCHFPPVEDYFDDL